MGKRRAALLLGDFNPALPWHGVHHLQAHQVTNCCFTGTCQLPPAADIALLLGSAPYAITGSACGTSLPVKCFWPSGAVNVRGLTMADLFRTNLKVIRNCGLA